MSTQLTLSQAVTRKKPVAEQIKEIAKAVVIGDLPLTVDRNRGLRSLITYYNGGEFPVGISYGPMMKQLNTDYDYHLKQRRENFFALNLFDLVKEEMEDPYIEARKISVQHDIWTNRSALSFLGTTTSYMNSTTSPWKLEHTRMAIPLTGPHNAENILTHNLKSLALLGVNKEFVVSATQDTAAASINAFDTVEKTAQLPCAGHTLELVTLHAVENCTPLKAALDDVRKILVRTKGHNSSKRREALIQACDDVQIMSQAVKIAGATRWG